MHQLVEECLTFNDGVFDSAEERQEAWEDFLTSSPGDRLEFVSPEDSFEVVVLRVDAAQQHLYFRRIAGSC